MLAFYYHILKNYRNIVSIDADANTLDDTIKTQDELERWYIEKFGFNIVDKRMDTRNGSTRWTSMRSAIYTQELAQSYGKLNNKILTKTNR